MFQIENNPGLLEAADDPEVARAMRLQREFWPKEGVDYDWVEDYTREKFQMFKKTFDDLDAKAQSIITFLTSATGVFTLGTLAAVTSAKVNPWAIAASIPSILCAVAGIALAISARRPAKIFPPPGADEMIDMAQKFPTESKLGRAFMIPIWEWCAALIRRPLARKVRYVHYASWLMIAAVGLLLLPLIASLIVMC